MNRLYKWITDDVNWWQFWRPQSGPLGGVIFGAVLGGLIMLYYWVTS